MLDEAGISIELVDEAPARHGRCQLSELGENTQSLEKRKPTVLVTKHSFKIV